MSYFIFIKLNSIIKGSASIHKNLFQAIFRKNKDTHHSFAYLFALN